MSQVEKALRKAFENWVNDYKNLDDTFLDYVCKHIALEDSSKEDAVTSFVEETFYSSSRSRGRCCYLLAGLCKGGYIHH